MNKTMFVVGCLMLLPITIIALLSVVSLALERPAVALFLAIFSISLGGIAMIVLSCTKGETQD